MQQSQEDYIISLLLSTQHASFIHPEKSEAGMLLKPVQDDWIVLTRGWVPRGTVLYLAPVNGPWEF